MLFTPDSTPFFSCGAGNGGLVDEITASLQWNPKSILENLCSVELRLNFVNRQLLKILSKPQPNLNTRLGLTIK